MKKTLLRKAAMASLFTLMTLTVTKANAKGTFIYGETDNGLIVSTLNEDGKNTYSKMEIRVPVRRTRTTDREESISMEFATTDVDTGLSAHYYIERLDMYHGLCRMEQTFL